jgi:DNA polymerase-3 subunit gamma/tau
MVEIKNGSSFDKKRLEKKRVGLQNICKQFLGKNLTIKIISKKNKTVQTNNKRKKRKALQEALNHPLVIEAQKIFDGEIINQ